MYLLTVNQTTNYPIYEWQILTILPLVLMMTNWELCRKIRMPKEENTYTTYSKIWGPRPASFAALILQLIVLTTGSYLIHAMGCSLIWNVVYALGFVGLMFPVFNYWRTIRTKKPLKFWAENQILWTVLSLITAGWWG
jgi:4-hydroxybenzoate polyprenyltransferase